MTRSYPCAKCGHQRVTGCGCSECDRRRSKARYDRYAASLGRTVTPRAKGVVRRSRVETKGVAVLPTARARVVPPNPADKPVLNHAHLRALVRLVKLERAAS